MNEIQHNLLSDLKGILPKECILFKTEELRPYECDALTAYKQQPLVVLLPESIQQVQAILRLCHNMKIPVVTRGAGTGLSGGALPIAEGVLLSLAKFNKIVDIDADNRLAVVQPGVRNLAISEAAADYNLYYAPDPSSQIACSIGGNVAENSGGVHCLKYGLTVHNVLALKIVLANGELITIGSHALDNFGFDLLALLNGSEGMLGVIVEITVKLLVKAQYTSVILASFKEVSAAGAAVGKIIEQGIIPAGLEMMDALALRAAEDFVHAGYPRDAKAILLCELDGYQEIVEQQNQQIKDLLVQNGASEVRLAQNQQERELFWKGRKAAFPAVGRISPDYYCMDGTIPRKHLPKILQYIQDLSEEYDLPVANVFHAGDGNLHPLILYDASIPGQLEKTEELGGKILEACVAVGGSITGEHGVGIEKINQMCAQFSNAELSLFHGIKDAFDEKAILNPGKAIPTLHRCAEFGAMHVHHGKIAFPDLERF